MKKKVITLLLSLVLASGSIGNVQVLAAEATEQEEESVQETETAEQDEEPVEEADTENAAAEVSEENPVPENEEPANEYEESNESDSETEDPANEEEFDTSEESAADVLETEETEITDESADALDGIVDSGSYGENITWTLTGSGSDLTLTLSGSGPMDDIWPDNTPWKAKREMIKEVVIEKGITSVGANAFYQCSNLTSVTIPDGVTSIGSYAFEYCSSLVSITIPDGVTSIGDSAFLRCTNLRKITIPDGVTSIGSAAFWECSSLESIAIPDGVTWIQSKTFVACRNLKSIKLPDSITNIDDEAFWGCSSLTSITIPYGVTWIRERTFLSCSSLTNITIPKSVTSIGYEAFINCYSLTTLTIPDSVTVISDSAFENCNSLTSVTIPGSVTNISPSAFEDCGSLKSITISDGVTTIGPNAFVNCSNLESISIPDSVNSIDESAFENCSSLAQITLPKNVKAIGKDAFKNCSKLTAKVKNKYGLTYCQDNGIPYIDCTPPEIKLASYNGSDIRVNITKKDGASGYQIKYADNSSMTGAKSVMLNGSDNLSKVITGLKNGQTYYVKVQSYQTINDTTYWSTWSAAQSIKITQTPYKTPITKLSTYIGSHIKVDWTKTAGASGYHIKYADNSSMTGAKEVMVKGNSTFTKTLTGLKNGKTYYVKIQTYRTVSGKTYWSSWSDAKSIMVDQKPYGSSISKLTNPSSKAMKITWDKASSASGYHIQYSTNSSMTGAKDININNKDTLSKTVTGLSKGKTYYVRIQTFRKVSGKTYWSSWSKAKQIKITK